MTIYYQCSYRACVKQAVHAYLLSKILANILGFFVDLGVSIQRQFTLWTSWRVFE